MHGIPVRKSTLRTFANYCLLKELLFLQQISPMTRCPGYVNRSPTSQKKINKKARGPLISMKRVSFGTLILPSPQVVYLIPLFKQQ